MTRARRIPELDWLRGAALSLMILHHAIFDLYHYYSVDRLAFQNDGWFRFVARPAVIAVFILVSGVCTVFSRDNRRRGLRMGGVALVLTLVTWLANRLLWRGFGIIFFNVIHVLAASTLLYALWEAGERRAGSKRGAVSAAALLIAGGLLAVVPAATVPLEALRPTWLTAVLWRVYPPGPPLMDAMALFPWVGVFLMGAGLGRLLYPERRSLVPGWVERRGGVSRGLEWMGRHALWIYLLHQPILLGLLRLLAATGLLRSAR